MEAMKTGLLADARRRKRPPPTARSPQIAGGENCAINQSRWYDSTVGRWLSQDPSGLGPDTNPYRYCGNDPTDGTDPSGLRSNNSREKASEKASGVAGWLNRFIPAAAVSSWSVQYCDPNLNWKPTEFGHTQQELMKALAEIKRRGGTITDLVIKGEGEPEGIMDGNGIYFIYAANGTAFTGQSGQGQAGFSPIGELLKSITDKDTTISLRGCNTAAAADNLAKSLDNGATVSGNPYKSLGVPFTEADVSIRWKNYSYGP